MIKPIRPVVGILLAVLMHSSFADNFTITTDDYDPYTIVSGQTVGGACAELIETALKLEGHTVSFIPVPWARATAMAASGEVAGTMPWFKTPEREAQYAFSAPVIEAKNVIFFKKGGKFDRKLNWRRYEDLRPYRMGGVIGYWYESGFKKAGVSAELVRKDDQNIQKLDTGRIDGFITDELVGKRIIATRFPGREKEFDIVEKPESIQPLFVMGKKGAPQTEKLIEHLNAGLRKLHASGQYARIVAKYK